MDVSCEKFLTHQHGIEKPFVRSHCRRHKGYLGREVRQLYATTVPLLGQITERIVSLQIAPMTSLPMRLSASLHAKVARTFFLVRKRVPGMSNGLSAIT